MQKRKMRIGFLAAGIVLFLAVQAILAYYFIPYLRVGRLIQTANQFERVVLENGETWIEPEDFDALRIVNEEVLTADDTVYITNQKHVDRVSPDRITFTISYLVRVTDDYRSNWDMTVKAESTAVKTITFVFRNFKWYVESVK